MDSNNSKEIKKNVSIIEVDDVNELFLTINENFANWPDYIFRGQAQSDWKLESSLTRALKKLTFSNKLALVKSHFRKFQLEIRGRRGGNPRNLNNDEIWALGQHFGLYTPLLDWSQSPYVALFFSLIGSNNSETGKRTLWALNESDIETIKEHYKNKSIEKLKWDIEIINPILDENERLVSQNGLFTKLGIETDIETFVNEGPDLNWITLFKINFPESLRDELLNHLNLMNINYSSLFPDLFGSSMNTNLWLEQKDYLEDKQKEEWLNE